MMIVIDRSMLVCWQWVIQIMVILMMWINMVVVNRAMRNRGFMCYCMVSI